MFTIKAQDLSVILDQAAPHRFHADGDACAADTLILDCTYGHLHVVGCSARTLAVARASIESRDVWTAPVGYDDAAVLRGWLDSSDTVTVEHITADGHQMLRFTEGIAQLTVPAASHVGRLPWRVLLRLMLDSREHPLAQGRPVQFSTDDLSLWSSAGDNGEAIEFRSLGPLGTLVTAGSDFLGLQTPHGWDGPEPGEGWSSSLRTRQFSFAGQFLEVGARYADATGTEWIVPGKPGLGEEPQLVSADFGAVALPVSQVLAVGKFLIRLHD